MKISTRLKILKRKIHNLNFSLYIAKRYLFSKSSNNAINIITIIATLGVIIGSLALFLVLSVFSGLKSFSVNFLNATDPDIRITALKGKSFFYTEDIQQILNSEEGILDFTKVIDERAFFNHNKKEHIAHIKGVDSNYTKVIPINSLIYSGNWIDFKNNTAVVGNGIANKLSLGILNYGEPLHIYVPKTGTKFITDPKKAFKKISTQAVGIFSVSEELDNKYVFTSLNITQKLLSYKDNQITHIDIKVAPQHLENTLLQLKENLNKDFLVAGKEELNSAFYKILNTEKLVAYLIFTLVLIIALFNVIGSIIMMILDKKSNLKTLYNLGAPVKKIKQIFLLQGFLLSVFGLFVGLSLGSVLILIQNQYGLFMLTASIPYPINFELKNILIVATTITLLGYFASKIASSRISKDLVH